MPVYCHTPLRAMLFLALLGLSCFGVQGQAYANDRLNILVVSSFSKGLPAQDALERGLDVELGFRSGRSNVYFEFLDSPRLPLADASEGVESLIARKYRAVHLDAVVAWAAPAAQLVARNRTLFAPDTPLIFLELDSEQQAALGLTGRMDFSLNVRPDYKTSLTEALQLSKAKRLVVIAEAKTPTGAERLVRFHEAVQEVAPTLPIEELLDLPLDQVIARTSNLPKDTLIYYLLMFSDGRGMQMSPYAAVSRIAKAANAPIFTQWESLMGSGVVGGYQLSMDVVGRNVGHAVLRLSQGQGLSPAPNMRRSYDWRQLEKWGWDDASLLSQDAEILNRQPDVLYEYRWHIMVVFSFILALIALSISLARALHARNQAALALAAERENLAEKVKMRTEELTRSNQELESFAYAISHDLRAPLRSVNGFAGLLEKRFRDVLTGEGGEFLGQIRSSAQQMDAMILGLLDYSRAGHQSPEAYESADLQGIAQEVLQMLLPEAERLGGSIELKAADLPALRCNKGLILRLIQNLVENALKYHSPDRPPVIRIEFAASDGYVKLSVHDNGVGIPENRREKIFQMFQRNAPATIPGYGIGLSLCQRIAEAHGGRIWVESEPDGGSCFSATLAVSTA